MALLQEIFEVDPLVCPQCAGSMRLVAFLTPSTVIDQILTPLRTRSAPSTLPEVPECRPPPPGSLVGAARCARWSGIEPPPADDGPKRSRPDDPQRTQPDERPPRTTRGLVARREASRPTSTTSIEFPIPQSEARRRLP